MLSVGQVVPSTRARPRLTKPAPQISTCLGNVTILKKFPALRIRNGTDLEDQQIATRERLGERYSRAAVSSIKEGRDLLHRRCRVSITLKFLCLDGFDHTCRPSVASLCLGATPCSGL